MTAVPSAGNSDLNQLPQRARRHPWIWIINVVCVVVVVLAIISAATTPGFEWGRVGAYLFEVRVLRGVLLSVILTVVTMALAVVCGVVVALLRMGAAKVLSWLALVYIWLFRSTPMLVLLLFFYNLAALYPKLSVGVPFGPQLFAVSTNALISPLTAAIIGLTLHESAYVAELVRSGLLAVPVGQREAAEALGLRSSQVFFRIILPQAMRIIVPPLGNEVISLLKSTSLVSVIALTDLLYSVQLIYSQNYETIPLLIVATIWYIVIVGVLTLGQQQLERRLARRGAAQVAAQLQPTTEEES